MPSCMLLSFWNIWPPTNCSILFYFISIIANIYRGEKKKKNQLLTWRPIITESTDLVLVCREDYALFLFKVIYLWRARECNKESAFISPQVFVFICTSFFILLCFVPQKTVAGENRFHNANVCGFLFKFPTLFFPDINIPKKVLRQYEVMMSSWCLKELYTNIGSLDVAQLGEFLFIRVNLLFAGFGTLGPLSLPSNTVSMNNK